MLSNYKIRVGRNYNKLSHLKVGGIYGLNPYYNLYLNMDYNMDLITKLVFYGRL